MNDAAGLHPASKDLVNLAQERLGRKKTERIYQHCKNCPPCADLLLEAVRSHAPRAAPPRLSRWNWISIALLVVAIVAMVVAMVWFLRSAAPTLPFDVEMPVPQAGRPPSGGGGGS